jgi:hypothetical protein
MGGAYFYSSENYQSNTPIVLKNLCLTGITFGILEHHPNFQHVNLALQMIEFQVKRASLQWTWKMLTS